MPSAAPQKNNPPSERLRVFLSYASEDNQIVSELYDLLKDDGVEPWMDTAHLRAGENWREVISKAFQGADAIIFCLSRVTLHADGVLGEIKRALDSANWRGRDGVLILPARLEECDLPAELAPLYYVDLFKADGYERLAQALNELAVKFDKAPLVLKRRKMVSSSLASRLEKWNSGRQSAAEAGRTGDGGVDAPRPRAKGTPSRVGSGGTAVETDSPSAETEAAAAGTAEAARTEKSADHAQPTTHAREGDPPAQSGAAGQGGGAEEAAVDGHAAAGAGVDPSQAGAAEAAGAEAAAAQAAAAVTPPPRLVKSGLDESARTRSATNDKPQTDVERDTLGFRDFVFALRDFVVSEDTTTPLTISVNGAWGSGKSSLMGMLQQQLETPPPAGLWRAKLGWLGRWARATPAALAGRLLALSEHWDAEYIRLGLSFAPAEEVTDENFEELLRAHVAAAVGAQFSPALLDSMEDDRAEAYVAGIMDRSRRWARAAARRRKMRPPSHPTVWFNAWKFSEQEQVWSALALALLEQLKTKYNFFERALFLVRLTLKRTDKLRAAAQLARRLLVPAVLAIAAVAYAALYESLKARYESYFVLPANLTWLAPALAAAWQAWKAIENPFHLPAAEVVDQPDYREKLGFIGAFEEDFARIVETAVRRSFFWRPRKLVVFIDDLDRCSPLQAAGVIEAINLFLDSVGCVFVLGMDMAAVATSIEVKYKELAERMRSDSPDVLSPGSLFLDKIVQIPFNVPRPNQQRIDALVASLTEPRAQAPRLALMPPPAPRAEAAPHAFAAGIDAGGNGAAAATAADSAAATTETAAAAETTTPTSGVVVSAVTTTPAAPQVDRGSFAREDIKQAVVYASRLLKENPRQVKRFVNLFRLQIYIADQRGLLSEEGEQGLTPKRLAVWVAWYMQWPDLLKLLSGATYGRELRENLASISRKLVGDDADENCGVEWGGNGKTVYLSELAAARELAEGSSSHWSKLPWQVWITDADFLRCLKHLEPYWNDRRLLDSVADMTQFNIDTPGVAAAAPPAPPAAAPSPAAAAPAHAGNGGAPAL